MEVVLLDLLYLCPLHGILNIEKVINQHMRYKIITFNEFLVSPVLQFQIYDNSFGITKLSSPL